MNELRGKETTMYEKLWTIKALPKTQVCVWRVLNKVSTFWQLVQKEIQVSDRKCILCKLEE